MGQGTRTFQLSAGLGIPPRPGGTKGHLETLAQELCCLLVAFQFLSRATLQAVPDPDFLHLVFSSSQAGEHRTGITPFLVSAHLPSPEGKTSQSLGWIQCQQLKFGAWAGPGLDQPIWIFQSVIIHECWEMFPPGAFIAPRQQKATVSHRRP